MHPGRTATMLIAPLLALAGLLPANALAAPEFLPTTAQTFVGSSGTSELVSGLAIKCTKDKLSGEVTGAKTVSAKVDFEECSAFGIAANSLGDAMKTILAKATGELCYINEATKEVGIYFTADPVHIEIPLVGELAQVVGTSVAIVDAVNLVRRVFHWRKTKPPVSTCGGKAAALKAEKQENKKPETATLVDNEEITFSKELEVMA